MERLYVVMPAYNEEKNIEKVVRSWHAVIEKVDKTARLLIVDDGSKDDTYNIIWDLQRELPQLEFQYKENSGHGATVLFAYEYAIARGATYIFQTDSDGQTNPEEFLAFWEQREKYDMIISMVILGKQIYKSTDEYAPDCCVRATVPAAHHTACPQPQQPPVLPNPAGYACH